MSHRSLFHPLVERLVESRDQWNRHLNFCVAPMCLGLGHTMWSTEGILLGISCLSLLAAHFYFLAPRVLDWQVALRGGNPVDRKFAQALDAQAFTLRDLWRVGWFATCFIYMSFGYMHAIQAFSRGPLHW
jgi:hypothetical protein